MRHKKLIQIISSVMISLTVFCSTGTISSFAEGTSGNTVAEQQKVAWAEQSVQSRIAQINNQNLELSGTTGAVNSMRVIVDSGIYLSFMSQASNFGLNFSTAEYTQYYNKFMSDIKSFNDAFSKGNGGTPVMALPTTGLTNPNNLNLSSLFQQVGNYIQDMCYKVNGSPNALSGNKLQTVVNNNKAFLLAVIKFENSIGTCVSSINNAIPNSKNNKFTIPSSSLNNLVRTPVINNLLQEAQKLNVSEVSNTGLQNVNANASILDQFYENNTHTSVQLSNDYYMLIACGAVYIPFQSYLGGTYFQKALKTLAGSSYQNIEQFYSAADQYMKPLYMKNVNVFSSPPAKEVTLREFIDNINSGRSFQLFLPKGKLQPNQTGTAFEYYTNLANSEDAQAQNKDTKSNDTKDKNSSSSKNSNSGSDNKTPAPNSTAGTQLQTNTNQITDMSKLTPSVFNFGKVSLVGQSNNTVVATNIIKQYGSVSNNEMDSPLFMDAFGDIVTGNGLVIIPACANSTLLSKNSPEYIYSTAFLGSYPSLDSRNLYFNVTDGRADGKYAVSVLGPSLDGAQYNSLSGAKYTQTNTDSFYGEQINNSSTLSYSSNLQLNHPLQTNLSAKLNSATSLVNFRTYQFKGGLFDIRGGLNNLFNSGYNTETGTTGEYYFLTKQIMNNASNGLLAVLYSTPPTNLTDDQIALIASNYYWYLTEDNTGESKNQPNNKMNNTFLARTLVPCILNGTVSPLAYANISMQDSTSFQRQGWFGIENAICTGMSTIINEVGNIQGSLGMLSAYNDPILGSVMRYAKQYFFILEVVVLLAIAAKFLKSRMDFLRLAIVIGFTGCVVYAFIFVLPVTIPQTFNVFNDSISKNIAYKSLMIDTENYKALAKQVSQLQQNVQSEITPSIDLYTLSNQQEQYYADQLGVNVYTLTDGNRHYLNYASGLFIQGNKIKQNLDVLFINNPILGRYVQDSQGGITYKLFNMKMANSSIDYYTPFYVIENNFISNLNKFAQIYQLTRSQINVDGVEKDSFLVEDFMKSPAFLSPDNYSSISATTSPQVIAELKKAFPNNGDFLGLTNLFSVSDKSEYNGMQDSLWFKTMKSQGITPQSNEFVQIVRDVNIRTKEFMIENASNFKAMPDANIIRIISLYATCQFDKDISKFNMQVYPQNINYPEITARDVMYASVANMEQVYMNPSYSVGEYINGQYSMVGLLIFTFCSVLETMIVLFMRVGIPILFLLMGFVIVSKFFRSSDTSEFSKGVIKSFFIMLICITCNTLLFTVVNYFEGSSFTMWILLFGLYIIAELLTRLFITIVKNPSTFGEGQFHNLTPALLRMMKLDKLMNRLRVATTNIVRGGRAVNNARSNLPNRYSKYSRYNSLDDMYLDPNSEIYGRRRDRSSSRRLTEKFRRDNRR